VNWLAAEGRAARTRKLVLVRGEGRGGARKREREWCRSGCAGR